MESFLNAGTVFIKPEGGDILEHSLLSITPNKNVFLLKLSDLNSLDDAERYRGAEIFIRKDCLKRSSEDEYLWVELIGLEVFLDNGRYLGILKDILSTGSNDIYVVRDRESEILIPAIHEVVREIDLVNKKMIISEIEGLLDLNEV
jgi:16S rRNA processing protein RimM